MASFFSLRLAMNHEIPHNQYVYATIYSGLTSERRNGPADRPSCSGPGNTSFPLVSSRHARNPFLSKGSRHTEEFRRQDPEASQQQVRGRW